MKKELTTVKFRGTEAQEAELVAYVSAHKDEKGALMPVLQKAQEIYGYLPIEVQQIVAREMDIPVEEIYGVATFYSQFSLNPKGEYAINVCLGTACFVKGAQDVLDRISMLLNLPAGSTTADAKYSLEATRCIGACGLAPVISINNEVYGRLKKEDVDGILAQYK